MNNIFKKIKTIFTTILLEVMVFLVDLPVILFPENKTAKKISKLILDFMGIVCFVCLMIFCFFVIAITCVLIDLFFDPDLILEDYYMHDLSIFIWHRILRAYDVIGY